MLFILFSDVVQHFQFVLPGSGMLGFISFNPTYVASSEIAAARFRLLTHKCLYYIPFYSKVSASFYPSLS